MLDHDLGKPCESDWETKGILDGAITYLIGSVENAKDSGISFRKELKELASQKGLKIKFLDPTDKIHGLFEEVGEAQKNIFKLRDEGKYDELRDFMKKVVRTDLRCVDLSDFVIAYFDSTIATCGSWHELFTAILQKKPILIVMRGGKKKTPLWVFGIVKHEYIFDNEEQCIEYLANLNNGNIPLGSKWVLARKQLEKI